MLTGGTPEVHSARSKLDGVLQTLVERKDERYRDILHLLQIKLLCYLFYKFIFCNLRIYKISQ